MDFGSVGGRVSHHFASGGLSVRRSMCFPAGSHAFPAIDAVRRANEEAVLVCVLYAAILFCCWQSLCIRFSDKGCACSRRKGRCAQRGCSLQEHSS